MVSVREKNPIIFYFTFSIVHVFNIPDGQSIKKRKIKPSLFALNILRTRECVLSFFACLLLII